MGLKMYDGSVWQPAGNLMLLAGVVSATAPVGPYTGLIWEDTTDGTFKMYNGTNWVVIGGAKPSYAYPSTTPVVPNAYDQLRGIYNYKSSNTRRLDQGLSNAMAGGFTEHVVLGDSGSAGCVSSVGTTAYFDRLRSVPLAFRDSLATMRIPTAGSGVIRLADASFTDSRVTAVTGTWTTGQAVLVSTVLSSTVTVTLDRGGSYLDVWYYEWATGGVFSISVNGAASGAGFLSVNTAGTVGTRRARLKIDTEKGSTVKMTVTTAGGGVYLVGPNAWSPNGGLLVHNVAQSGSRAGGGAVNINWSSYGTSDGSLGYAYDALAGGASAVAAQTLPRTITDGASTAGSSTLTSATGAFTTDDLGKPLDQSPPASGGLAFPPQSYIGAILSGTTVTVYNGYGANAAAVNAVNTTTAQTFAIGRYPSCVHVELGLNDLANGRTVPQVITDITTVINRYKTNSDIMLHLVHEMAYSFVAQATQAAFWIAMYNLADTLDIPLYDWRDRVGTYANGIAAGAYGDINVHLTPGTYADIGASLAMIVGGGSGPPQVQDAPTQPQDIANRRWVEDTFGRQAVVTPAATVLTTAETIVAQVKVPANMLKVGSRFVYDLSYIPSVSSAHTVRIRVGTAGTISDASVVAMSPGVASASGKYSEGVSSVRAIGASATHLGRGTETAGTASTCGTAAATSGTFDSTQPVFVSLTLQSGTSNTTTLDGGVLLVKI